MSELLPTNASCPTRRTSAPGGTLLTPAGTRSVSLCRQTAGHRRQRGAAPWSQATRVTAAVATQVWAWSVCLAATSAANESASCSSLSARSDLQPRWLTMLQGQPSWGVRDVALAPHPRPGAWLYCCSRLGCLLNGYSSSSQVASAGPSALSCAGTQDLQAVPGRAAGWDRTARPHAEARLQASGAQGLALQLHDARGDWQHLRAQAGSFSACQLQGGALAWPAAGSPAAGLPRKPGTRPLDLAAQRAAARCTEAWPAGP